MKVSYVYYVSDRDGVSESEKVSGQWKHRYTPLSLSFLKVELDGFVGDWPKRMKITIFIFHFLQ